MLSKWPKLEHQPDLRNGDFLHFQNGMKYFCCFCPAHVSKLWWHTDFIFKKTETGPTGYSFIYEAATFHPLHAQVGFENMAQSRRSHDTVRKRAFSVCPDWSTNSGSKSLVSANTFILQPEKAQMWRVHFVGLCLILKKEGGSLTFEVIFCPNTSHSTSNFLFFLQEWFEKHVSQL